MRRSSLAPRHGRPVSAAIAALIACAAASLPAPAWAESALEYNRDIRPILAEHCFACHGPDSAARKADLRLDQRDLAIASGSIQVGHPDKSELIQRITSADPELVMPPAETKKTLTGHQKELLRDWIAGGAEYQPHWSLLRPTKPSPPAVRGSAWVKNPIDRFVLARLEAMQLHPAPEADPHTLFRRLCLDLTGLPPQPADSATFASQYALDREVAMSRWIDRLMQSPAWGEHRARYWLDAARYGDTHGLHFDNYREMWPYRDWVIRAFGDNLPFDQFTVAQIAGDLLPHPTQDQLIATGFQRCNITTNEGGTIDEENVANYAADRVQTIGWVYLGLTSNCSQCHDHKFDPFTMHDYYALAAFFRNTTQPPKDRNSKDGGGPVLILPADSDAPRWAALPDAIAEAIAARDARKQQLQADFEHWLAAATSATPAGVDEPVQKILQTAPQQRTPEQQTELLNHYLTLHDAAYPQLENAVRELEAERTAIQDRSPMTHIQAERTDQAAMAHVLIRGEYDRPSTPVQAATPAALHPMPPDAPRNRLGLARWLVNDANPLTARVTVNRFWQQVFGRGIVSTTEDFGVMGSPPTHPELLDWLTVTFREEGWDVKRLFKLMMMSATYRQAAVAAGDKLERDPDNSLLSRGPRFRMDAEMVRDYALAASGRLSSKMFGPSVRPYQPENIWNMVGLRESDTRDYVPDTGEDLYRRTVYTFWKRMAPPPNLEAFNAPSREFCTVRRERTNTPLQALVTLNDPQYVEAARCLAQIALLAGGGDDQLVLDDIANRVLCRTLQPGESKLLLANQRQYLAHYTSHHEDALNLIAVGESHPDETLQPATLAAWTMVCNEMLNLDETLNK